MKIRVIMDSGKEYEFEELSSSFIRQVCDETGKILNEFVRFNDTIINPIHISSIEIIED